MSAARCRSALQSAIRVGQTIPRLAALLLWGLPAFSWSFPWDQDMVDQPAVKPQESRAPAESEGIPITGGETLPDPATDEANAEAKKAAAALPNPVPASVESLARGARLYETNCLVCHGRDGRGDGPVGSKFVTKAPVDLNDEYTQDQADGQLFFTLTRGRALMPAYRDALSVEERWHLVNYVKRQFGNEGAPEDPQP